MGIFINPNAIQDNSMAKDKLNTSLKTEIDNKQEALTLTVKDNGNIVLANIQGQSKEFMPATPSGDPMHYAYVAAGAEYNDTGADIVKTAPWADMVDDDTDKTVIHTAGYWYLNGLGDITNEQMRRIYMLTASNQNYWKNYCNGQDLRTNILTINEKLDVPINLLTVNESFRRSTIEVIRIPTTAGPYTDNIYAIPLFSFMYMQKLKFVIGIFGSPSKTFSSYYTFNLKCIKIAYLSASVNFQHASNLSVKSVLYMIQNEKATSAITITLHADVYNRCMANADILAALETHTNISLASA